MNIYGITHKALCAFLSDHGENPAKADIIFRKLYREGCTDFGEMGFSRRVAELLQGSFSFSLPKIVETHDSSDTAKLLLMLSDGEFAETVLMRQRFGSCICVSTQVGCAMGCAFCRSGRLKRRRNLTPDEIIGQLLSVQQHFGVKVSGISVMGIGEPFDNFGNLADFLNIAAAPHGLAIGEKHITVSTCGLVPEIMRYAELPHPCNLAISLHAPNDVLRDSLMPINRRYGVRELMRAVQYFSEKHNRRVTLEYIMLEGVNDTPELARQLSDLIGDVNCYVNIIPYNPTDGDRFRKSSRERIMAFYDVLKKNHIGVTMRREFGSDLKAACGQLSADYQKSTI